MRILRALLACCGLIASTHGAAGVSLVIPYPATGLEEISGRTPANKVLRIMQDYAAPSVTDGLAWATRQMLAAGLQEAVEIDRRSRRGGGEGHERVAQAMPDGRTLLLSDAASMVVRAQRGLAEGGDPLRRLVPVALIAEMPVVLIVQRATGVRDLATLTAAARSAPGRLHLGSAAEWSVSHLAAEYVRRKLGLDMLQVPYNGGGGAVGAVLKGQIEAAVVPLPAALGYVSSPDLRVIAVSGEKRHPELAQVPTFHEQGMAGLETAGWFGLFAPPGTPRDVVVRVNRVVEEGLKSELVYRLVSGRGLIPAYRDGAAFASLLRFERERWGLLIATLAAAQHRGVK